MLLVADGVVSVMRLGPELERRGWNVRGLGLALVPELALVLELGLEPVPELAPVPVPEPDPSAS